MFSFVGFIISVVITYSISAYFFADISMLLADTEWGSLWTYLKWASVHACWFGFWISVSAYFSAQSVKMSMKNIDDLRKQSPRFDKH